MQWALLAGVPEEELRTILQVARRRSFAKNEVVFHRGDPADCFHLIAQGRFAIRIMTPLGDTATLAIRGPGATFGEMALLIDEAKRTATVAARGTRRDVLGLPNRLRPHSRGTSQRGSLSVGVLGQRGASVERAAARSALPAGRQARAAATARTCRGVRDWKRKDR